jgi:two-component system, NtrC family, nitrogen regulation sensor histidine kinase GlnL
MISERDAANLLNHLGTAIVVFDPSMQVVGANLTAETLIATSTAKLRGVPAERLFPAHEAFRAAWSEVLRDGRSFTERNVTLVRANQETVSVECMVSPMWRAGYQPSGVILEMSSNERYHRIQADENRLLQNHMSTALMRGLAHEVKNPLGGIRGAAQLLERELHDPKHREYTQIIIGEADRLRKLVDRMLGPRGQTQLARCNIHEILEHVRAVVGMEVSPRVHVHRDYDPSLPDFDADRDLLVQAYLNLVRNAVQAINGHGGNIVLRTRVERQHALGNMVHRLVLRTEVEDDGPGVASDLADSIFFPMVSSRADGSGLGLPIAQSLVQRHGGLIEFASTPGKTVFIVWLPVRNSL